MKATTHKTYTFPNSIIKYILLSSQIQKAIIELHAEVRGAIVMESEWLPSIRVHMFSLVERRDSLLHESYIPLNLTRTVWIRDLYSCEGIGTNGKIKKTEQRFGSMLEGQSHFRKQKCQRKYKTFKSSTWEIWFRAHFRTDLIEESENEKQP